MPADDVRTIYLQWEGEGEGEGDGEGEGGKGARMRQNMAQPVLKVGAATSPAPLMQHFCSAYGHAIVHVHIHTARSMLYVAEPLHMQCLCNFSEHCLQVGVDIQTCHQWNIAETQYPWKITEYAYESKGSTLVNSPCQSHIPACIHSEVNSGTYRMRGNICVM